MPCYVTVVIILVLLAPQYLQTVQVVILQLISVTQVEIYVCVWLIIMKFILNHVQFVLLLVKTVQ